MVFETSAKRPLVNSILEKRSRKDVSLLDPARLVWNAASDAGHAMSYHRLDDWAGAGRLNEGDAQNG